MFVPSINEQMKNPFPYKFEIQILTDLIKNFDVERVKMGKGRILLLSVKYYLKFLKRFACPRRNKVLIFNII